MNLFARSNIDELKDPSGEIAKAIRSNSAIRVKLHDDLPASDSPSGSHTVDEVRAMITDAIANYPVQPKIIVVEGSVRSGKTSLAEDMFGESAFIFTDRDALETQTGCGVLNIPPAAGLIIVDELLYVSDDSLRELIEHSLAARTPVILLTQDSTRLNRELHPRLPECSVTFRLKPQPRF